MQRWIELRTWAEVAAKACKKCSVSVAFVIREDEIAKHAREHGEVYEKSVPRPGCEDEKTCKERIRLFWPSRPLGKEKFHGLDIEACPKDPTHNTLVVLVGQRKVPICAECSRKTTPFT